MLPVILGKSLDTIYQPSTLSSPEIHLWKSFVVFLVSVSDRESTCGRSTPIRSWFFCCLIKRVCTIRSHLRLSDPTLKLLHHGSSTIRKRLMVFCSLRWKSEQQRVLASNGESVLYTTRLWPIKLQTICLKCFLSVAVLRRLFRVYYLL